MIVCAPAPLNVTVLVPGVNVPPLLVQLPEALILVAVPAVRVVPELKVKVFKVSVVVEPPIARALALVRVILLNV